MSWFTTVSDVAAKTAEAQLDAGDYRVGDFGNKEMLAQVKAAKAAAVALIASGALGKDPAARYHIAFNGHANPGHEITQGWSNDTVTITVTRLSPGIPNASGEPLVTPQETS